MGTVLFAWELGGGLGHVGPMKVLAEALRDRGHQPVFAVKNVTSGQMMLGDIGPVLQAPVADRLRNVKQPFGVGSFGDLLALHGFDQPQLLARMTEAWSDLFDLVRPELIVADFSPTVHVAAYSVIPIVTVGYGFYLPPDHLPQFPAFREDVPPVAGEGTVLATVQDVLSRFGRTPPKTLPSLFRAHYSHVYSLPPLDPYADYRRTPGFGPIEQLPRPSPMPAEPSIFAYLSADDRRVPDIIVALGKIGCRAEIYLRGAYPALLKFAARRGVSVHEEPPPFTDVMPRVSHVISHGGGGISHAALLAGRPHLLFPTHAEAYTTAGILERLWCGRRIRKDANAIELQGAFKRALDTPKLTDAAQTNAKRAWSQYYPESRIRGLIEACDEIANASRAIHRQTSKPHLETSIL